jgi:hypothetical protein
MPALVLHQLIRSPCPAVTCGRIAQPPRGSTLPQSTPTFFGAIFLHFNSAIDLALAPVAGKKKLGGGHRFSKNKIKLTKMDPFEKSNPVGSLQIIIFALLKI